MGLPGGKTSLVFSIETRKIIDTGRLGGGVISFDLVGKSEGEEGGSTVRSLNVGMKIEFFGNG